MTPTLALDTPSLQLSENDVLDLLLEWDYAVPVVAERLNTTQSAIKAIIARNQPIVAQHMRALSTLSMFDTFSTARDTMLSKLDDMESYDVAKVYEHAAQTLESITRTNREGVVINNNNNINMLLSSLPSTVRERVEQLVQMSDADFEAIEAAAVTGTDEGDAPALNEADQGLLDVEGEAA